MRHMAIFVAAAAIAAGPALAESKSFDITGFTRIAVSAGLDATVAQGETFSVTAEGSARALKRLDIERRGDTLFISQSAKGLERFSPILSLGNHSADVLVALPEVEAVQAGAGSDVTVTGGYGSAFSATAGSGANLDLQAVAAPALALDAGSGADIEVAGACGHLVATASSGANIDARDLVCDSAELSASSGADIEVEAAEVVANASSGANIDVYGGGNVEADASSGGDVDVHD